MDHGDLGIGILTKFHSAGDSPQAKERKSNMTQLQGRFEALALPLFCSRMLESLHIEKFIFRCKILLGHPVEAITFIDSSYLLYLQVLTSQNLISKDLTKAGLHCIARSRTLCENKYAVFETAGPSELSLIPCPNRLSCHTQYLHVF